MCLSKSHGLRAVRKEILTIDLWSQRHAFRKDGLAGDTVHLDPRYCCGLQRSGRVLDSPSAAQTPSLLVSDPGPTHHNPWPELQALGREGSGRPHGQHSSVMTAVRLLSSHPSWKAALRELQGKPLPQSQGLSCRVGLPSTGDMAGLSGLGVLWGSRSEGIWTPQMPRTHPTPSLSKQSQAPDGG